MRHSVTIMIRDKADRFAVMQARSIQVRGVAILKRVIQRVINYTSSNMDT